MAISILELHRPPGDDELFSRYLRELLRHGDPEPERTGLAPGNDVRTCTRCGEHALFRIVPDGCWAECASCRTLA